MQPVEASYLTGQALGAVSVHPDGRVWKPTANDFVVYVEADKNLYWYPLNELVPMGYYRAPYPAGIPKSVLTTEIIYWLSDGATLRGLAAGDMIVGIGQSQGVNIKLVNDLAFPNEDPAIAGEFLAFWEQKATMQSVWPVPVTGKPTDELTQFAQQNDVGLDLIIQFLDQNNIPLNLSDADEFYIKLKYPDGTSKNFEATLWTDGTDGKIFYTTAVDDTDPEVPIYDLSQSGLYDIQGYANIDGKKSARSGKLRVYENVNDDVLPPVEP
jgi:hypothetical protein